MERSGGSCSGPRCSRRGQLGEAQGVGARWADWPPLPPRNLRAHEVSESERVIRATHAFGVLAIPVPVGVHLTSPDQIEACTRAMFLVFSLRAYQDSRRALTGEFTRRMPTLVAFVRAWLALHKPVNEHKFALTAKSFFLQEAEGLSRAAKLAWSRLRGAGEITSLQHDGVVMVLSQGVTPTDACAALTEVCTAVLGYAQPVEEKRSPRFGRARRPTPPVSTKVSVLPKASL